ncbi:MAG: copper chaperone PCu(A)C [Brachybacterium tyrofermentans]|uniref:Copper chaperone PCu(A)C n=1 Tax=Brachybacterium tyrofermentans TaxID=47848 RepID=A0ABW0FF58_9MICO|nr:Copper metallochaperone, bacterial analog of Cox17 protein [Corynebacterium xerosis]
MFRISRTTSTTRTTRIPARSVVLPRRAALASLLALPLAACSAGADGGSAASEEGAGAASDGGAAAGSGAISVTDPWVKAADEGMTAAFGTITNGTDADLVLTAVTTPATDMVQLHETTSDGSGGMSMQEKDGGFPLPAGEDLVLEPGGDHIMLMDLPKPLQPGDTLELTLVFSEGTEHPFTATVKDFSGAQEHYAPGEDDEEEADHEGMSGMASDGGGGGEHEGHK